MIGLYVFYDLNTHVKFGTNHIFYYTSNKLFFFFFFMYNSRQQKLAT